MTNIGPFQALRPIVLASASPRREELLSGTGLAFEIVPSEAEEPAPGPGETPGAYACRMAWLKAREVASRRPGALVIGADTVVAVGREILGKPRDRNDARRMTALLSGREHVVVTGCAVVDGEEFQDFFVETAVRFADISPAEIEAYTALAEPYDKAGGYAIQGQGAFLIREIRGSYTNVVGLPVAELLAVLKEWGAVAPKEI